MSESIPNLSQQPQTTIPPEFMLERITVSDDGSDEQPCNPTRWYPPEHITPQGENCNGTLTLYDYSQFEPVDSTEESNQSLYQKITCRCGHDFFETVDQIL